VKIMPLKAVLSCMSITKIFFLVSDEVEVYVGVYFTAYSETNMKRLILCPCFRFLSRLIWLIFGTDLMVLFQRC
jgi:hypothetical protein